MTPAVFTRCAVERGRDDRFYAVAIYGRRGELLDAHVFRTGRSPLLDELLSAPLGAWPTIAGRYEIRRRRRPSGGRTRAGSPAVVAAR